MRKKKWVSTFGSTWETFKNSQKPIEASLLQKQTVMHKTPSLKIKYWQWLSTGGIRKHPLDFCSDKNCFLSLFFHYIFIENPLSDHDTPAARLNSLDWASDMFIVGHKNLTSCFVAPVKVKNQLLIWIYLNSQACADEHIKPVKHLRRYANSSSLSPRCPLRLRRNAVRSGLDPGTLFVSCTLFSSGNMAAVRTH